jgi:hypothetical protein
MKTIRYLLIIYKVGNFLTMWVTLQLSRQTLHHQNGYIQVRERMNKDCPSPSVHSSHLHSHQLYHVFFFLFCLQAHSWFTICIYSRDMWNAHSFHNPKVINNHFKLTFRHYNAPNFKELHYYCTKYETYLFQCLSQHYLEWNLVTGHYYCCWPQGHLIALI